MSRILLDASRGRPVGGSVTFHCTVRAVRKGRNHRKLGHGCTERRDDARGLSVWAAVRPTVPTVTAADCAQNGADQAAGGSSRGLGLCRGHSVGWKPTSLAQSLGQGLAEPQVRRLHGASASSQTMPNPRLLYPHPLSAHSIPSPRARCRLAGAGCFPAGGAQMAADAALHHPRRSVGPGPAQGSGSPAEDGAPSTAARPDPSPPQRSTFRVWMAPSWFKFFCGGGWWATETGCAESDHCLAKRSRKPQQRLQPFYFSRLPSQGNGDRIWARCTPALHLQRFSPSLVNQAFLPACLHRNGTA